MSIRDFINASSVIVKIGMGKSLLAEWEKTMEEEKGKYQCDWLNPCLLVCCCISIYYPQ